ncbi:hypothetical protein IGS59_00010 [Janthinobacterium sp. GW460P]|uniref:hypothetical protein n=1 Tax=unclassified Janthinobacterium TaxID=2610881 RepID=UPI000A328DD7|nr:MULTISPECIES: hypothetical protein [unclassified Janthinobacterium]MCC7700605.1 hypothetical protein [Janthinobacterium sp. GW460P]MCC7706112.1 hypothetical protein [Janthinobacterium sp. GW460W]
MKTLILAAVLLSAGTAAVAQVSVTVGQPGFYGRIDIGDYPAPQLIYAQPVIVQRPQYYSAAPIYLRVPPGHAKHWSKHCRKYNACNQEVYFVQDGWYNNQYVPRYRQQHGDHGRPDYRDRDRHDDRHDKHYDKRDKHDDHPGKGHGNGRGNGNGNGNGHRD